MDCFKVNFRNCHGIKKLTFDFHFEKNKNNKNTNVCIIYAPNGTMKTSFAKTLKNLCEGNTDELTNIANCKPIYNVKIIEDNKEKELISSKSFRDRIFVISSLDMSFDFTDTAPLIYDKEAKEKYNEIFNSVLNIKKEFFKKIKQKSKITIKKNNEIVEYLEKLILSDFDNEYENIFDLLIYYNDNKEEIDFLDEELFIYDNLFSEKVLKILEDEELIENIEEYVKILNKLLNKSKIFNKSEFTHYNAEELGKNIKSNNLFSAGHKIKFKSIGKPVENIHDFNEIINLQYKTIYDNKDLKNIFQKIDNKFSNKNSRNLRRYITNNPDFIIRLKDIKKLKRDYWISLFFSEKELSLKLIEEYNLNKDELKNITKKAKEESTNWEKVIDIFNSRFNVPFKLELSNKEDVILKENIPIIKFIFETNNNKREISLKDLKKILSTGETRALYMLNIIYKINILDNEKTKLLIFDDIADSFDYQNKYAIIEYLYDLSKNNNFRIIILTHNYDFFRTVKLRLNCKNFYFANKNRYGDIKIEQENTISFIDLVNSIEKEDKNFEKSFIASIPFIRNLAEYTRDNDSKNILTNLLHYKEKGKTYKIKDLKEIYKKWNIDLPNKNKNIYKLIFDEAKTIATNKNNNEIGIANKIVLSIAIRLHAEKFMLSKLDCNTKNINKNQTRKLYDLYREKNPNEKDVLKILNEVNIMTPENIHINSFMYEPLIDIDDFNLIKLYEKVQKL